MTRPVTASASAIAPTPREHGAWELLLQPFVAAAILAGFWHWLLLPTLALVLLGFLLKEPLVVLARQRWVWRSPDQQTPVAWRWLAVVPLTLVAYSALDDLCRGKLTIWVERYKWPLYDFVSVAF